MTVFWIFFIILLILAFIPAHIAGGKGYNSVGYYIFGLFFFLPALVVVLLLQDKIQQQDYHGGFQSLDRENIKKAEYQKDVKVVKPKKMYVRNLYMEIPLRPCYATILLNDKGEIVHSIYVRNYKDINCDSLSIVLQGYDVFENLLYTANKTIVKLTKVRKGFIFDFNIESDKIDIDAITYLEVYIEAYASELNVVKFENQKKSDYLIPVNELAAFKQENGEDAIVPFVENEDHWICVCGNRCEGHNPCSLCGRKFGQVDEKQLLLDDLSEITSVDDIKERLLQLEGIVPDEEFDKILLFVNKIISMQRVFNIKEVSDIQKKEIEELLTE